MTAVIKCVIAKMNPLVMDMAIKHYIENGSKTPLFTFKSLYSDDEPYPLDELLIVLSERIETLAREFKAMPSDSLLLQLSPLRKKFNSLYKISVKEQNNDK
ncbi:hypothetical protein [Glaesserella parasuis]|uniref:hypothetical protein n=2 Tax=Glaesserella parasuis TaxID=738 RepID=UPI0002CA40E2|nr:hypothetical protein [Glaesserella parasuis]EMY45220.1 hypothetical protein OE7_10895 [Glaesserella parasuis gx033]MDG6249090.1 hypothetical protein [Glaesserella parasuis]MDG6281806.1 hypothetical protein [Glaesserella parasuis]MDG6284823.1 hypothetical protein [Glaesserella parasuis]MDG6286850.1 hypothetical protein [Glaesserella parasuis]